MAAAPTCVDCIAEGVTTARPIASGTRKKRCTTHTRAAKKQARLNAHARTTQNRFQITGEQYWALYEAQGGRCAVCRIATGKTKRLAVEHDHKAECIQRGDHPADTGCPLCIRGLACGPCNQNLIVHPVDTLLRAVAYKFAPPGSTFFAIARFFAPRPETGQPSEDDDSDPPASTESDEHAPNHHPVTPNAQ